MGQGALTRTVAGQLQHVFWFGGMSGVGKTTAARTLADRNGFRLYSFDKTNLRHAELLPPETRTLDQIWVDLTPEELADWFDDGSAERFELVLNDVLLLPRDRLLIVEGPQLLPNLVAPLLTGVHRALFVIAPPGVQHQLVAARGSRLYGKTRDPDRALRNRLARDAILAARRKEQAEVNGLTVIEVNDVSETLPALERHLELVTQAPR